MDKYHAVRFVLETVDEYLSPNRNWAPWFARVSKMFRGSIPDSLLAGLERSNFDELTFLCTEHRESKEKKMEKQRSLCKKQEEDEKIWLERRDAGNRAHVERMKQNRIARKQAEALSRLARFEAYEKEIQPKWEEALRVIKERRDIELQSTLNPSAERK